MGHDDDNRRERARAALVELARAPARASHTAEVLALLDEIEKALAAGASRTEVWERLRDAGAFEGSFQAFTAALKRARKRARRQPLPRRRAGAPVRNADDEQPRKRFSWDPLERPNFEFVDRPDAGPGEEPLRLNVIDPKKPKN